MKYLNHESISHLKSSSISWKAGETDRLPSLDRLVQGDQSQVGLVGEGVEVGVQEDGGHRHSLSVTCSQIVPTNLSRLA